LNIIVCIKQTFDTEEPLLIVSGNILEDGVKFVINPYDEYALEEAIRLKERCGGEVTVVAVGPGRTETALRSALAMGADRAVWLEQEQAGEDEFVMAAKLAAIIRTLPFDLILCGYMAVDSGAGQGGARLAEELGIPHAAAIVKLELEGSLARVERDAEGDKELLEVELPAVLTAQQGLNEPRYPSLPGIMKAKKKPLQKLPGAELGLGEEQLRPRTAVSERYAASGRSAGLLLDGEPREQAADLVRRLLEEKKLF